MNHPKKISDFSVHPAETEPVVDLSSLRQTLSSELQTQWANGESSPSRSERVMNGWKFFTLLNIIKQLLNIIKHCRQSWIIKHIVKVFWPYAKCHSTQKWKIRTRMTLFNDFERQGTYHSPCWNLGWCPHMMGIPGRLARKSVANGDRPRRTGPFRGIEVVQLN